MFMTGNKMKKAGWYDLPPWIIIGAVAILVPIFVFWAFQNIAREKEFTTELLLEKGAALIRSFEAGARTGMMGMMGMNGTRFQLQKLLTQTAQQPDILYIIVTDIHGTVLAHSDPVRIGGLYATDLNLRQVSNFRKVRWRQISGPKGARIFEVYRRFMPTSRPFRRFPRGMMHRIFPQYPVMPGDSRPGQGHIIFVGLDMQPIESARKADTRHTIIMAAILLLIGFAGIVSLFLAQAYRSARMSLSKIKAFSDSVVENMPIGLLATDRDSRIAAFNQAAETILKVSAAQVLGKKAGEVLPRQIECLIEEIDASHKILQKEMDCPLENGMIIPMDISVSFLEGDDGTFLGHVILFRDLSEIQDLKREVERNQRLASLGRLAAGVAHEIRNPLSSIKGFATYFRDRYRDVPEDHKTAEVMIAEVERLNRVIGQLLEFARPMTVQKRPTSLQSLIQHSLKTIERDARARGIDIRTTFSDSDRDVEVDPDRMNQVFLNLYLNAIEAMEDGGTLSVAISREEHPKGRIKITVSDTGMGISRADLDHIFDPYFTTKQSGTGLGLAIVHKIMESHGGEVKVASEPGKGTAVSLFLPSPG